MELLPLQQSSQDEVPGCVGPQREDSVSEEATPPHGTWTRGHLALDLPPSRTASVAAKPPSSW